MREFHNVHSTAETVKPYDVQLTTTYIRTNIRKEDVVVEPEQYEILAYPTYDEETGEQLTDWEYGELIAEAVTMPMWVYDERQYSNKEYIEVISQEKEELKKENILLKAQVQASADRADFHEDLIAEMAILVYQ